MPFYLDAVITAKTRLRTCLAISEINSFWMLCDTDFGMLSNNDRWLSMIGSYLARKCNAARKLQGLLLFGVSSWPLNARFCDALNFMTSSNLFKISLQRFFSSRNCFSKFLSIERLFKTRSRSFHFKNDCRWYWFFSWFLTLWKFFHLVNPFSHSNDNLTFCGLEGNNMQQFYTYRGYQDIDFIKKIFPKNDVKKMIHKWWINIIYINILLLLII